MSDNVTLERVSLLVTPILADLKVDLYDLEFRGGTLRITVDAPAGSDSGVNLESIALATRLISRELDYEDPVPGHYTLEVTSPGLERTLRTPAHFQRAIGQVLALRLRDIGEAGERRIQGQLLAADEICATLLLDDGSERVVAYPHIDRARTVFEWGPAPKPGKSPKPATRSAKAEKQTDPNAASPRPSTDDSQEGTAEVSEANGGQPRPSTDDSQEGTAEVSEANGGQPRPSTKEAS